MPDVRCHGNGYRKKMPTGSRCRCRRGNSNITVKCVFTSAGILGFFRHANSASIPTVAGIRSPAILLLYIRFPRWRVSQHQRWCVTATFDVFVCFLLSVIFHSFEDSSVRVCVCMLVVVLFFYRFIWIFVVRNKETRLYWNWFYYCLYGIISY